MFGIIISGHGKFAEGFEKTIELVMGNQPKMKFINFSEGKTPLNLEKEFKDAIEDINLEEILVLTDIAGGTPFLTAALMAGDTLKVVSGCNMAMIVEAINLRDSQDLKNSVNEIIESAIEGIEIFEPILKINIIDGDGI